MSAPIDTSTLSGFGLGKSKLQPPKKADIPPIKLAAKEKEATPTTNDTLFRLGESPQEKALKPNSPRGTYLNILI